MKKANNQTIKCNVESCKFNDCNNNCELNGIQVSCTCDENKANKDETICESFKKRD